MTVTTNSFSPSSVSTQAILTSGEKTKIVASSSAGVAPGFYIAADGSKTLVVDPATQRALIDQLDESVLGDEVFVETEALFKLAAEEQANPAGAPMLHALGDALAAGIEQFKTDHPLAYQRLLEALKQEGPIEYFSISDLLQKLNDKGVDCTIALLSIGAETQASATLRIYENKMDNVSTQLDLAIEKFKLDMNGVIAKSFGAVASLGIGAASTGALLKAGKLQGQINQATGGVNAGAAVPGLDAAAQAQQRIAAAAMHPSQGLVKRLEAWGNLGTPGATGANLATEAGEKSQVALAGRLEVESQAKIGQRDAESGVDESLKAAAERIQSSAFQIISDLMNSLNQARDSQRESLGKMAANV